MNNETNKGKNTNKVVLKNLANFFDNPFKNLQINGKHKNRNLNEDNLLKSVFQIN
jgi:hypothetical protein